jgi:hypothetical protein
MIASLAAAIARAPPAASAVGAGACWKNDFCETSVRPLNTAARNPTCAVLWPGEYRGAQSDLRCALARRIKHLREVVRFDA